MDPQRVQRRARRPCVPHAIGAAADPAGTTHRSLCHHLTTHERQAGEDAAARPLAPASPRGSTTATRPGACAPRQVTPRR